MKFYFLENIFNEDDRALIDCCIRGMYVANRSEVHSGQHDGAYGSFSEGLERIFLTVYGKDSFNSFYNRYNFDHCDGSEFIEWFDAIIKEDKREIADMLSQASIQV